MKKEAWQAYADAEVLAKVTVRLITPEEKARWDQLITERHYLKNAHLVGRQLRYVAELDGAWVALLGWNAAAYHLKGREAWLNWSLEQRLKRRKFVVQNSRYLLLVDRGRYLTPTQLRLLRCYYSKRRKCYVAPSEPTIRRLLALVPAAEFDQAVTAWLAEHDGPLRRVAVDGKTVKQAKSKEGRALHLVAAVTHDSGRLVAQRPVAEKSNEITALRPLLQDVPLDNVVVTADAMQAQQDAARFVTQEKGGDYFFSLKGNQPSVQEAAERLLNRAFPPSASGASQDGG